MEEEEEEKQPKKVGKKLAKKKREETTNKEKFVGIQTTIEKSLGLGSQSIKYPSSIAPSNGGDKTPTIK
jgi:hypothetical protein